MKAPNFRYMKPASLDQALDVLARQGAAAVPLAGGQSLIATLNLRLSAPDILVDISDLDELTELHLPQQKTEEKWGFAELARRHGDFALAGLAAICRHDGNTVAAARLVYFGCTDYAKLAQRVAAKLCGQQLPLEESEWLS